MITNNYSFYHLYYDNIKVHVLGILEWAENAYHSFFDFDYLSMREGIIEDR